MKLMPAPDDNDSMVYCRLVSEDGKIEMGIYPTIYGFRIRAGKVGSMFYYLDWCCGARQNDVEMVYAVMKRILESREADKAFEGLRGHSDIKPLMLDPDFFGWMMQEVSKTFKDVSEDETDGIWVDIPPLQEIRNKAFNTFKL